MTPSIKKGSLSDLTALKKLYSDVAHHSGGLARKPDEMTDHYFLGWVNSSLENGLWMLAQSSEGLLGSIHAYRPGPRVLNQVLGSLTIAIHPHCQGQGVGRFLFSSFLKHVENEMPEILRVELMTRESNTRALQFYESLGFKKEGRLEKRILSLTNPDTYEADIPMAWLRS